MPELSWGSVGGIGALCEEARELGPFRVSHGLFPREETAPPTSTPSKGKRKKWFVFKPNLTAWLVWGELVFECFDAVFCT